MDIKHFEKKDKIQFSAFDIELTESISRNELITTIKAIKTDNDHIIDLQSFKYNSLLSYSHLKSAVWHSLNAYINGNSISKQLSIEFILYVSGQRQISKALENFGIDDKVSQFSIIIFHIEELSLESINLNLRHLPIIKINDIKFQNHKEKLIRLASIFNYDSKNELNTKDEIIHFNKFILSCISNLVFEG